MNIITLKTNKLAITLFKGKITQARCLKTGRFVKLATVKNTMTYILTLAKQIKADFTANNKSFLEKKLVEKKLINFLKINGFNDYALIGLNFKKSTFETLCAYS